MQEARSYNLRSTGSMLRGTFVLRRHIWLVLTRAVDTMQANVVTTLSFDNHLRIWLNFAPSKHWIWQNPQTRSYNLTSTASMLGGTKLLRRHIWLVLIHAVEIKQANVMIMLFFGKYLRIWLKYAPSKHWIWKNPQMCTSNILTWMCP